MKYSKPADLTRFEFVITCPCCKRTYPMFYYATERNPALEFVYDSRKCKQCDGLISDQRSVTERWFR